MPGTIQGTTPITGLQSGETIHGIDSRPATGSLRAGQHRPTLHHRPGDRGGDAGRHRDLRRAPERHVLRLRLRPDGRRLRVVSDAGQNMRLNPDTGAVIDSDPNIPGTQPDMYLSSTYVVGLAYSDNAAGTTTTTLYGIDGANDWLVRQGGPSGSPSPNLGQITTIGSLGVDLDWAPVSYRLLRDHRGRRPSRRPAGGWQDLAVRHRPRDREGHGSRAGRRRYRRVGLAAAPPVRPSVLSISAASPTAGGERGVLPDNRHPDRGHGGHGDGRLRHGRRHRGRRPGLRGHQRHSRLPASARRARPSPSRFSGTT